jgi:hypothetical protein
MTSDRISATIIYMNWRGTSSKSQCTQMSTPANFDSSHLFLLYFYLPFFPRVSLFSFSFLYQIYQTTDKHSGFLYNKNIDRWHVSDNIESE